MCLMLMLPYTMQKFPIILVSVFTAYANANDSLNVTCQLAIFNFLESSDLEANALQKF